MASAFERRVMTLSDGRDLAWMEMGSPTGFPVLAMHGSPGSALDFSPHHAVAMERHVRLIALDRPGYGHSSYHPRRTLAEWAGDVHELATRLALTRFAVMGHSAGGPHALACARYLGPAVSACGVLCGVAPPSPDRDDEEILLSNRVQAAVYRRWPSRLDGVAYALGLLAVPVVAPLLRLGRRNPERAADRAMRRMLPDCDLAVVARPAVHAIVVDEVARFSLPTARASIQDMALGMRDWDFDLADITGPVHIWHGDQDRNVPLSHGRRQAAAIPAATLHLCPGEGHWLPFDHMSEIIETLVDVP